MADGAMTVGQLVGQLDMLEVTCRHCDRRGRYLVDKLLAQHGPGKSLIAWKAEITADCPRRQNHSIYEQCGAMMPDLPRVFPPKPS